MVQKQYEWTDGAKLDDHSKRKHKILREYFYTYISVRCQNPKVGKFRLAVVDGFSGGGRYECGTSGSPIIFLEELRNAYDAVNLRRQSQGFGPVEIECLIILNDASTEAIEFLKYNCEPLIAEIKEAVPKLYLKVIYSNEVFETAYARIKQILTLGKYRNVLFNLDQCGHTHVERKTIFDIMRSNQSVEIFYTFAIEPLLAFLSQSEPELMMRQLKYIGLEKNDLSKLEGYYSKNEWLGIAEKLVFEAFKNCATFVSPFSINNPDGWRYWFIHFANNYRARQVYNDVLHNNSSSQAHFGRSGLNMLSFNPDDEGGELYLFDKPGRETSKIQLMEDIPRLVSECGDAIEIEEFYGNIYNTTPAHKDDIHGAISASPDLKVITPKGGERRRSSTIVVGDMLKLKSQKSFFPMFSNISTEPIPRNKKNKKTT